MEYKSQRLYRDARIFSIYEGTTQLQVVAAIRYITNGTYLSIIKEMLGREVSEEMKGLKGRVEKLVAEYEKVLADVKAEANQEKQDSIARRLYELTADIIMSLLIIEDASRAPELFAKSANVFVRHAEEEVLGHVKFIDSFSADDLAFYRQQAAEAEAAE